MMLMTNRLIASSFIMISFVFFSSDSLHAQDHKSEILRFFNALTFENIESETNAFYSEDVEFHDPAVDLKGLKDLKAYYAHAYENAIMVKFDFKEVIVSGDQTFSSWVMRVKHKRINSGEEIVVPGGSHITFANGKAIYHRDYFDLGAQVYEHLPVIGWLVGWVKSKIATLPSEAKN